MEYEEFLEEIKGRKIVGMSYENPIKEDKVYTIGSAEIDGGTGCYLKLDDGRVLRIWISEFGNIDLLKEKR